MSESIVRPPLWNLATLLELERRLEPLWLDTKTDAPDFRRGVGRALVEIRELKGEVPRSSSE